MTDKLRDAAYTSDPDPADIIAGALQTSRAHAYELMHKALAQQDAQAVNRGYDPGFITRLATLVDKETKQILEDSLSLIEQIKYMVGIAERGTGRKCPDDECPEAFLLAYVKSLEAALAQQDAQAVPQGWGLSRQKGMVRGGILVTSPDGAAWEVCGGVGGLSGHLYAFLDAVLNAAPTPPAQQDAQAVPTQRQYELALGQWESWKAYALELQAKLVKYEGGSPMVLNAAPTQPAQEKQS